MIKNDEKNLRVMVRIKPEEKQYDFDMLEVNES